jgi:hypothetical protein
MPKIDETSPTQSMFINPVRVLKADELEKVVGARYESASQFGRYKRVSWVDNQMKDPA